MQIEECCLYNLIHALPSKRFCFQILSSYMAPVICMYSHSQEHEICQEDMSTLNKSGKDFWEHPVLIQW